jgi:hypothetical protein
MMEDGDRAVREAMRFAMLRKSRAISALLVVVWLVRAGFSCVVPPLEASPVAEPETCHVMDEWYPGEHGAPGTSRDLPPAQTCCELTGKSDVMLTDAGGLDEPVVLVFDVPAPALADDVLCAAAAAWNESVEPHGQDPPLYLAHSIFLI